MFDYAADHADEKAPPPWVQRLQQLVDLFQDAKNYGSLLTVDADLTEALPRIRAMLGPLGS